MERGIDHAALAAGVTQAVANRHDEFQAGLIGREALGLAEKGWTLLALATWVMACSNKPNTRSGPYLWGIILVCMDPPHSAASRLQRGMTVESSVRLSYDA
jgi:hypothetical protein